MSAFILFQDSYKQLWKHSKVNIKKVGNYLKDGPESTELLPLLFGMGYLGFLWPKQL